VTPKTLLDSDILSAVFRGHPTATATARSYLADRPQLTFSVISRYEILRGLKAVRASTLSLSF
jgi:tRNA(fMet)-specific endonuclease VapC